MPRVSATAERTSRRSSGARGRPAGPAEPAEAASSSSRSATSRSNRRPAGSIGVSSTSIGRRRRRRTASRQALTVRRWSQASSRSGSRRPGRSRQARMIRLLDRVPRELRVPEDEAGDGLQPRDGRADERREGVMIAPARSLDEIPLVHGHPRDAIHSAAFKGIGVSPGKTIPSSSPRSPRGSSPKTRQLERARHGPTGGDARPSDQRRCKRARQISSNGHCSDHSRENV